MKPRAYLKQYHPGLSFYSVVVNSETIGEVYFRGGAFGYWVAQRGGAFLGCHYSRKEAVGELIRTWRQITA